jgi:hypothetical protein
MLSNIFRIWYEVNVERPIKKFLKQLLNALITKCELDRIFQKSVQVMKGSANISFKSITIDNGVDIKSTQLKPCQY